MAHYLRKMGVRTGDTVAVLLDRSIDLVVAEIAVLKCSAAYVPINAAYSEERKAFLISDCEARAVLVCEKTIVPAGLSSARVNIDKLILDEEAATDLYTPLDGEALAYIMYTSGSTGQPKGVMEPHRGIIPLIWNNNYTQFNKEDRLAFGVNPSFDVSTLEVWAPLLNGGCVVIIRQKTLLDPAGFGLVLEQQAVTILWLTVGLFNQYAHLLQKQFAGLRYLMSGGDVLDPAVVARVLSTHAPQHLLNGYGPTESTTFTTTYEISAVREDGSSIPIGRPISNTQVYILDTQGEPVPVGVAGELYVGGAGVALGYLNRPELTAEKFVQDPFSEEAGARMYRTGDLSRWLRDGNIEFLGRNDFQVKIRGFRVELGEIEARLTEFPGVRVSVVVVRNDRVADSRLVAYYTAAEAAGQVVPGAEQLRAHLLAKLPEYMVPAAYVRLESLPLTPNGKLDRKGLPTPGEGAFARQGYEEPRGEIEIAVAAIWAEALKIKRVGRYDNFFQLGGHSLLTLQVVNSLANENLYIQTLDLFAHPTVESLATRIELEGRRVRADRAVRVRKGGSETPLFLVHDGLDELLYVPALTPYIDPDIPIYGLPAQRAEEAPIKTVEGMAIRMLRMIREVQPVGPYRLAGWSFGGVLAYEIAVQLVGADEVVEFVGLLDSTYPAAVKDVIGTIPTQFDVKDILLGEVQPSAECRSAFDKDEKLQLASSEVSSSAPVTDFATLVQKFREISLAPESWSQLTISQVQQILTRVRSNNLTSFGYSAQRIPIPIHLFVAEDNHSPVPFLGWNTILPETQIRAIPVPGTHFSMMATPNIETLGQAMSHAICGAARDSGDLGEMGSSRRDWRPSLES